MFVFPRCVGKLQRCWSTHRLKKHNLLLLGTWLEAIAIRLEAIAIAIIASRPSLGWRPSLAGWRPSLLGCIARTLLGAPGRTTRSKDATSSKDASRLYCMCLLQLATAWIMEVHCDSSSHPACQRPRAAPAEHRAGFC